MVNEFQQRYNGCAFDVNALVKEDTQVNPLKTRQYTIMRSASPRVKQF